MTDKSGDARELLAREYENHGRPEIAKRLRNGMIHEDMLEALAAITAARDGAFEEAAQKLDELEPFMVTNPPDGVSINAASKARAKAVILALKDRSC